jgi:hypothetical protein
MGQDAQIRHASSFEIEQTMAIAQIDEPLRSAIIAGDGQLVGDLLGAKPNLCAVVFPVDSHTD